MKTKKRKYLASLIISFVCLIFTIFFIAKVNALEEVKEAITKFKDEYVVGTEIEVPDVYFTDGDDRIKASKVIKYPDGSQYIRNEFVPNVIGNYVIEYSAVTASGEYLVETKNIKIYNHLYELNGLGNNVYYGSHTSTPNTEGLCVSLSGSGQFVYNKVIDLSTLNQNTPFISMYMTPETVCELDSEAFVISLTDIYDEDNYVEIKVSSTRQANTYQHGISYIQAGAANQALTGLEENLNIIHRNNIYGFPQNFTFFGCDYNGNPDETFLTSKNTTGQLQLFFDLDTKVLSTHGNSMGFSKIIDLDDPRYFSDLWNGFTTGEVLLTIAPKNIVKNTMNFVVTEIAGETLNENRLVDETGPKISIDTLGYSNLPNAIVGQAYPVFAATAHDAYSPNISIDVAVYMNYGSPAQRNINIENGKFTPLFKGKYYIVYTSKDYSGNVSKTVLDINCVEQGEEIILNIEEENVITEAYVGEIIGLPKVSASGGIGNIDITTSVIDETGTNIDVIDNGFKAFKNGKHYVTFTATDFVSTTTSYEYVINITTSNKPVFEGDARLFDYYISGYEYTLPMLKAFDYSNDGKEAQVTIKVLDDKGVEKVLDSSRKMTFINDEVGTTKTMKIIYECSNSNGTEQKVYDVNVVSAKKILNGNQRLDVSKYFHADSNINVEVTETETIFSTDTDGRVEFINSILVPNCNINLLMINSNYLGSLKLTLEDVYNSNESIEVIISKNKKGETSCIINNQIPYDINIPFKNGEYVFSYDAISEKFTIDGNNYTSIGYYKNGNVFDGFSSKIAKLSIELIDVTGTVNVAVKSINGQEFNSKTLLDRVSPRVYAYTTGKRVKEIGEVVTIYPAVACDVLDPEVQITLKVLGPDNKPIKSVDGILLDNVDGTKEYQISVSEYGSYLILYSSFDEAENDAGASLSFKVLDAEKPQINLSRENVTSAKKNETIVLAPATISDNYSTSESMIVCCFVVRPSGNIFTVNMKTSNSFVANECGTYTIRYMGLDEAGNAVMLEQQIVVHE